MRGEPRSLVHYTGRPSSDRRAETLRELPIATLECDQRRCRRAIVRVEVFDLNCLRLGRQLTDGFVVGISRFDSFSYPRASVRWLSATVVPLRSRRCGAEKTRDREQILARIRELRVDASAPCRSFDSIGHARIAASRLGGGDG